MGSLKVLLVYSTLLVVAFGKTNNTPTPVPTPSSTSQVPAPTSTPTPTPTPSPPPNYNYKFVNPKNTCRIMLSARMFMIFTYNISATKNHSVTEILDGHAKVDNETSYCHDKDSAALVLTWNGTADVPRLLSFNFTGGSAQGSRTWQFKNLTLTFDFDGGDFPYYPANKFSTYANFSRGGFFDDVSRNVEYQRSYRCNTSALYYFNNFTNQELNVSINVTNFRIQAFEFKNITQFGKERVCVADGTPGSKIVPIAVGAALGVLVIAVIIAYVISKVVNRKKSSYEAL